MRANPYTTWALIAVVLTGAIGYPLHLATGLAPVWSYLLAVNLATFLLYRADKWASPHQSLPRIPNVTLALLGAVGGAAGALLGVAAGHKTSARYLWLRLLLWLFLVVQLGLVAYAVLAPPAAPGRSGAHTITLVKSESGAEVVESWAVDGQRREKLEMCEATGTS